MMRKYTLDYSQFNKNILGSLRSRSHNKYFTGSSLPNLLAFPLHGITNKTPAKNKPTVIEIATEMNRRPKEIPLLTFPSKALATDRTAIDPGTRIKIPSRIGDMLLVLFFVTCKKKKQVDHSGFWTTKAQKTFSAIPPTQPTAKPAATVPKFSLPPSLTKEKPNVIAQLQIPATNIKGQRCSGAPS